MKRVGWIVAAVVALGATQWAIADAAIQRASRSQPNVLDQIDRAGALEKRLTGIETQVAEMRRDVNSQPLAAPKGTPILETQERVSHLESRLTTVETNLDALTLRLKAY